jgi:hypothetical protein
MTVKELIAVLSKQDPARLVVLSRDAEGNGYSPLRGMSTGAYVADCPWSGEVGLEELTDGDRHAGYSEEDVKEDGVPCLVLSPAN